MLWYYLYSHYYFTMLPNKGDDTLTVTIKDIAKLANVSRSTVDKVINNRPGVKKETRERIEAIIKELDYQPNLLGKALVMSKDPTILGVILTPEYNPFIQVLMEGIEKAEKEFSPFGIKIIVKMLHSLQPAELVSIMTEFETMGAKGIAFLPIDDLQVIKKANQLAEDGMAIVTFNSKLKDISEIRYVGQNHVKAGRVAAGLMEKLIPDGGDIGVIISSKTLSCHPDRLQGFSTRLEESNLNIVDIQENQDRRELAFKIALEYCNKYPNLKGIYLSGSSSNGVYKALALADKLHNVKIISHDLVPENKELLKKGFVDFVIAQSERNQGYQIIKELFDFLIKKQAPASQFYEIPVDVITKEMITDF